jgi:thiamine-phosphate pyrophosphorylase
VHLARLHRARPAGGLPRLWLFSDPLRLPDPLAAAARLPRGAGVVARGLDPAMLARLAVLARRRGLVLVVAGDGRAGLALRAGMHLPDRRASRHLLPLLLARRAGAPGAVLTMAAHGGAAAAARARRLRPELAFLSPVFPTASHPGAPALGALRWALAARRLGRRPVAALGGIASATIRRLPRGVAAVGAIGGLLPQAVAGPPQCLR